MVMNAYGNTRKKLSDVSIAFHSANYSLLEVNYPDHFITDIEKSTEFIVVEFVMTPRQIDLAIPICVEVTGQLVFNHHRREGGGLKPFTTYSDALFSYLGLKTIDGVTYREVQSFSKSGKPGFDSMMNVINFQIDYFNN